MSQNRTKILIVDDEPIKRAILEDELQGLGYAVTVAANPLEAEPLLADTCFDVVLTDLRMPGQDGLSFLRDLKQRRPSQAAIVMTAYGSVETAVAAMKLGAFDYLQKPFSTEELLLKLDKLLRFEQMASENNALRRALAAPTVDCHIVGKSEAIRGILTRIHAVAETDATVLIYGESGTGKELVARMIHECSHRAKGPFVAISCAALPKDLIETELFGHEAGAFTGATNRRVGYFESAHGGTLFLDDVDDIPLAVQVKLLRVLQEHTVQRVGGQQPVRTNVRVVSATKKMLPAMVAEGQFREDLYYRLNVVPMHLPLLRDRRSDIPLLVEHFLEKLAIKLNRGKLTVASGVVPKLQSHHWPGNVRELEHVLERMVVLAASDHLEEADIPELSPPREAGTLVSMSLAEVQQLDMASVEALAVPRSTLQYKVAKLNDAQKTPSQSDTE